ncbi:hypothetical protein V6N13_054567 [Hibiscus sabdariffa]
MKNKKHIVINAICTLKVGPSLVKSASFGYTIHVLCSNYPLKFHILSILDTLLNWFTRKTITFPISFVMDVPVLFEDACTGVEIATSTLISFVLLQPPSLLVIHIKKSIKDGSTYSLVSEKDSIRKLKRGNEIKERNANLSTHFEIEYCHQGHGLIFYEAIEKIKRSAICSVCYLKISDEAYACRSCRFYIHKTCNRLSSEVSHPLHPQHSLKLITLNDYGIIWYKCQGCATVNMEFAYICYACGFVLDVKCATSSSWVPKTETQRLMDMERESKLCLFNQHHKLDYANYAHKLSGFGLCSFCGLYLLGLVYRCGECGYSLHESCVGFPWEMQIQFHPRHLLRPLWNSEKRCSLCTCLFIHKISYGCVQCGLHLHVECAKSLKHVLKSKSHIHGLYYFGSNTKYKSHIHDLYYFGSNIEATYYHARKVCGECKREFSDIPFCFCMECDIKLHIGCVLSPSLKSKYHIHPLTLEIGFKENDLGEYYCDICEEERDPMTLTDHVYNCTKCRVSFVAHLSCALNSEEEIAASLNLALDSCPSRVMTVVSGDESEGEVDVGFTNDSV